MSVSLRSWPLLSWLPIPYRDFLKEFTRHEITRNYANVLCYSEIINEKWGS